MSQKEPRLEEAKRGIRLVWPEVTLWLPWPLRKPRLEEGGLAGELGSGALDDPLLGPAQEIDRYAGNPRRYPGLAVKLGPSSIGEVSGAGEARLRYRFMLPDGLEIWELRATLSGSPRRKPRQRAFDYATNSVGTLYIAWLRLPVTLPVGDNPIADTGDSPLDTAIQDAQRLKRRLSRLVGAAKPAYNAARRNRDE